MKRSTRTSLLMSVIAMLLCVSMLVGSTFAWFTDSVTATNNVIVAGNLDVELYYQNDETSTWQKVDATSNIFKENTLWEPGHTEVVKLRVVNEGTLALKYDLAINIANELGSTNKDGAAFKLSDYIYFGVIDGAADYTRETAVEAVKDSAKLIKKSYLENVELEPADDTSDADEKTVTLVVYMPETVGNEANYKKGENAPEIHLGINVSATQLTYEEDSFDNTYDENAEYPANPAMTVDSMDKLLDKLENATFGTKIYVAPGEYEVDAPIAIPSGVSLYGAQRGVPASEWIDDTAAEKTVFKSNGANVFEIIQTAAEPENATSDIIIDGVMIDCQDNAVAGIRIEKTDGEAIEGIKIVNNAVVNSANDGINVQNAFGAVIENNYVRNVKDNGIRLGNYNGYHYETWAEVTAFVRNNVIENVTGTQNGAIMLENGMGDVIVSGNVIKNVTTVGAVGSAVEKASAITIYDVYEGGKITVTENTLENVDQGIAVYKYTSGIWYGEDWWEGPTTDNDGIVISNNAINEYKTFAIKTLKLNNEGNSADTTAVEITDNTIVSTVTANALVIDASNNNWSVVASGNTLNGADSDVNGTWPI